MNAGSIICIIAAMDTGSIIAAIIPSALFLFLIFYQIIWKGGGYTVKIVKTQEAAKIVGMSTKTTNETFVEDDLLLWKEFKRIKNKNLVSDKKEYFSFVSVRITPPKGVATWEYIIGRLVNNFKDIPVGFKSIEIPPQLYAAIHLNVKNEESWGPTVLKLEKHIREKWLPDTHYEIDTDSKVTSIVYHDKREIETTRTIIYYLAIKDILKMEDALPMM